MPTRPLRRAWPLLAALVACAPAPEHLRVAALRQPATGLFFVAQATGCFAREGLRVDEQTFDLGRDAVATLGRDADVAMGYEAVIAVASATDPALRVLTELHTSTRNTRLVARSSSGIAGFADLGGKRVALARGTNADFFIDLALRFGGVPRAAVTLVDLAPVDSARALVEGRVDAAVLWDPVADRAERALGAQARTLASDLYTEFSLVVARAPLLEARPEAMRRLLRGLACAEELAARTPAEALQIVRGRFPDLDAATVARQVARVRWALGLDHVLVDVLRRERESLVPGAGGDPELDPRLLGEVLPEAVMLLGTRGGAP